MKRRMGKLSIAFAKYRSRPCVFRSTNVLLLCDQPLSHCKTLRHSLQALASIFSGTTLWRHQKTIIMRHSSSIANPSNNQLLTSTHSRAQNCNLVAPTRPASNVVTTHPPPKFSSGNFDIVVQTCFASACFVVYLMLQVTVYLCRFFANRNIQMRNFASTSAHAR